MNDKSTVKNTGNLEHPGDISVNRPDRPAGGTPGYAPEGNTPESNLPESHAPEGRLPVLRLMSGYIHEKRRAVAVFLAGMLLFFIVCLLYHLENMADLLYAFFLWAFAVLCFGVFDFVRYAGRYEAFRAAIGNTENLLEMLPRPGGLMDRQYHMIIEKLAEDLQRLRSEMNLKDADMNDYYSMWAHQVKVPISAMRLLLQNRSEENDETRLLSEELFKIEQYIDMVLYYQRLESISSDFLFKRHDLHDIVKQALKKYALLFINSRLSLDLQEFSCVVVTDEKWLQFALGQVISNALKYTHRGGISIYLEKTPADAFLVIEDTGIGIRPEDLPRIFERGYTGYNGRLDKKSTGIGLYLCRKILDKLSHTIEVTSEVGKGTKVTIGFSLEAADDL
jgi:signal transduction histidine kinase